VGRTLYFGKEGKRSLKLKDAGYYYSAERFVKKKKEKSKAANFGDFLWTAGFVETLVQRTRRKK
jgi:hypothetical protein